MSKVVYVAVGNGEFVKKSPRYVLWNQSYPDGTFPSGGDNRRLLVDDDHDFAVRRAQNLARTYGTNVSVIDTWEDE